MYPAFTLLEYRIAHPDTAAFPTMTQSGALGPVLARRQSRVIRSARREFLRESRRRAVRAALVRWWRSVLPGAAGRYAAPALPVVPRGV